MNSRSVENGRWMKRWLTQHVGEVLLRVQTRCTPERFLGSTTSSFPRQGDTSVENGHKVLGNVVDGTVSVDPVEQTAFFVPCCERSRLLVVGTQPIQHRAFVVVCSTLFLILPARTPRFGDGIEGVMVHCTAMAAGGPSTNALDDAFIGDFNGKHVGDLGQLAQRLCLWNGSWKSVEHDAVDRIRFLNTVFNQGEDDRIGNQLTSVHVSLCFHSNIGPCFYGCTEHIAGGDLW